MGDLIVLGRFGEERASSYLKDRGYQILERNFRCGNGEIDIIARKDNRIVFVEVKTRQSFSYGAPCEAVNRRKRKKLLIVAGEYIAIQHQIAEKMGLTHLMRDLEYRLDIIEVLVRGEEVLITHRENAFEH